MAWDQFGQCVTFNFNGNDTERTLPGGLLSVFLLLCLASYSLLQFKYMIVKQNWTLTQQEVMLHSDELRSPVELKDYGNLSIALQFNQKR